MFTTIDQIKAHKFVGNAHSDGNAFLFIEYFVINTRNSIEDRAEALRIMSDKGMGCGRDEHIPDDELVNQYLQDLV